MKLEDIAMFRFNKDKIDINVNLDLINKSAVPLLIENETWIDLFNRVNDKEMRSLKKQLKTLVDESREIGQKLYQKKEEKKKQIAKILTLSEKVNNNEFVEGVNLLDDYKEELNKLNDDLDQITFKSETIPSQIRKLNLDLLVETIKYAYMDIIDAEENLEELEIELNVLRERLSNIIKEKYDYEEKRNEIYAFLHNTLGAKEVGKLDRDILD